MRGLPGLGFELNVAVRFLREGRFQSLLIIVGVARLARRTFIMKNALSLIPAMLAARA